MGRKICGLLRSASSSAENRLPALVEFLGVWLLLDLCQGELLFRFFRNLKIHSAILWGRKEFACYQDRCWKGHSQCADWSSCNFGWEEEGKCRPPVSMRESWSWRSGVLNTLQTRSCCSSKLVAEGACSWEWVCNLFGVLSGEFISRSNFLCRLFTSQITHSPDC